MIVFCYNSVTVKVDVSEYQQFALEEMAEITELISIYLYCYVKIQSSSFIIDGNTAMPYK
jgi:hypothetical protein